MDDLNSIVQYEIVKDYGHIEGKHYKEYIQVGLNIMRCRKEQGLSQEQLAEMTGYSRHQIQRVETAHAAPTIALLIEVSEALNVPLERLIEIR